MKKSAKQKHVKAWAILNHYGDLWTTKVFSSENDANMHMIEFWTNIKNPPDMSGHKVVEVIVTITLPEGGKTIKK